jgi:hypothetical protein
MKNGPRAELWAHLRWSEARSVIWGHPISTILWWTWSLSTIFRLTWLQVGNKSGRNSSCNLASQPPLPFSWCSLRDKFFLLTLQSHPVLVEGTLTWTLPFNVAMSELLWTSYPLYILWLQPLKKTFQTWTRSPAQVLTLAVSASFIKHAEKTVRDDRGKSHTEKVLLPLLTDLFHLLLSDGVTPHLWHKVKITPLHKKGLIHPHRIIAC